MKLSCTQENLAKGLSIVARSVGTRASLPVLNNILLQTQKGGLKLSATDLEIGIYTWIGSKVDADGAFTVPARLLADFVNNNSDKNINLELKESTLRLTSDHYKANIKGIEASEFPLIPEIKKDLVLEIGKEEFEAAVRKTAIAAAIDESRPTLAGVCFVAKDEELKMVATDSYRLAETKIKLAKKIDKEVSFIIPGRTMAEMSRILGEAGETIKIYPGDNQVEIALNDTILVSRLIEGIFPDYQQIIPKETKTKVEITTSEFTNAIKMASLFARESANNIKLKISAPSKVEVLAVSPHVGDNVSEIVGKLDGEGLEIAFNAKFILDILQVINSDKIVLELTNNLTAGLIKSVKDPNFLYLIMPLRIEE